MKSISRIGTDIRLAIQKRLLEGWLMAGQGQDINSSIRLGIPAFGRTEESIGCLVGVLDGDPTSSEPAKGRAEIRTRVARKLGVSLKDILAIESGFEGNDTIMPKNPTSRHEVLRGLGRVLFQTYCVSQ